jgi:hypothetical protein
MAMTLQELEDEVKILKQQVTANARAKDYLEIWKLQSRTGADRLSAAEFLQSVFGCFV